MFKYFIIRFSLSIFFSSVDIEKSEKSVKVNDEIEDEMIKSEIQEAISQVQSSFINIFVG